MGPGAILTWRNPTVDTMLSFVLTKGFLFVKAPPNTGKTSLAQLVERRVLNDHRDYNLVFVSFGAADESDFKWSEFWEQETDNMVTWADVRECKKETVIILDEVQKTYMLGKGHEFWLFVKSLLTGRYLKQS
jgi:predicted AAA+ superfamily ATPase